MTHFKSLSSQRILALFTLLFCLVLSACGTGEQQIVDRPGDEQQVVIHPNDNEQQEQQSSGAGEEQQVVVGSDDEEIPAGSSLPENISFIITIRINPELQIHVDDMDCIVDVLPMNADADDLCHDLEVIGMNYSNGLPLIMVQAQNKGYLENGDFVEVQIHFQQASQQTMEKYNTDINTVIQQYAADHALTNLQFGGGISAEVLLENEDPDWTPDQPAGDSADHSIYDASNIEILKTDASGNVLRYLEHHDDHTREFFQDANGHINKCILSLPNGTVITSFYHANGDLAQEITFNHIGEQITTSFDSNGMIQNEEVLTTEGTKIHTTFYSNGRQATQIITEPDGSQTQRFYSEDGLSMVSISPNGNEISETYHEDGTIAIRKADYGSSILEEHFDNNGELTYSVSTNSGIRVETFFNADRSGHMITYSPDGSQHSVYFRPDGKVTHGYDSNGNYYEETGAVYAGTKNGGKG